MEIKFLSVRVEADIMKKLRYIAKYEDRSVNREIQRMVRQRVKEFEAEHGEIVIEEKPEA